MSHRIQLLLRPAWRTQEGIDHVRRIARDLGLDPTGAGAATVSVRAEPDVFARVFGSADAEALPVPDAIGQFVESASLAPEHQYFKRDAE